MILRSLTISMRILNNDFNNKSVTIHKEAITNYNILHLKDKIIIN